jgi:DNA repair exonuclease SbcCD ATPase subunit
MTSNYHEPEFASILEGIDNLSGTINRVFQENTYIENQNHAEMDRLREQLAEKDQIIYKLECKINKLEARLREKAAKSTSKTTPAKKIASSHDDIEKSKKLCKIATIGFSSPIVAGLDILKSDLVTLKIDYEDIIKDKMMDIEDGLWTGNEAKVKRLGEEIQEVGEEYERCIEKYVEDEKKCIVEQVDTSLERLMESMTCDIDTVGVVG